MVVGWERGWGVNFPGRIDQDLVITIADTQHPSCAGHRPERFQNILKQPCEVSTVTNSISQLKKPRYIEAEQRWQLAPLPATI